MDDVVDSEQDVDFIKSELTHFVDYEGVHDAISKFCLSEGWEIHWDQKWEWLTATVSKYQEQSSLLNPHLENLITPICSRLIELMDMFGVFESSSTNKFKYLHQKIDNNQFHILCKVLQLFCRVRGFKHVVKLFPHEVSHIEACILLLHSQDPKDYSNWETRYILMLWLCILCIIPFDICSMDSSLSSHSTTDSADSAALESSSKSRLVQQIVDICMEYMSDAGPTRDAASACLSTLLTRPDMESDVLNLFIGSAIDILDSWSLKSDDAVNDLTSSSFQLVGVLHCLSQIFKKGHRRNIFPHATPVLRACFTISVKPNQTLTRKLLTKLFQRLGLTFLPPRVASWRYQRGNRSLVKNLSIATNNASAFSASVDADSNTLGDDDNGDEDEDVPSEIEEVVERLLVSLRDKDTVVRWSAAKGVGRLTMRLPRAFADDVIGAVLELFDDIDDDSTWHGGCLALAELSRRGLLLPDRLAEVIPIVNKAMHFDVLRGQHSVGAHVRDAASYVCWAFARAYSPHIMSPFVNTIADAMILVALFDREVNCRRAASAAFQENVGRQGNENFPLGIEITTIADYFSLGIRSTAYLEIAPAVAKLSDHLCSVIVDHLCSVKYCHWDENIRSLAAQAMGKITSVSVEHVSAAVLRVIPVSVTSPTLFIRHGAVLLAAEVLINLSYIGPISAEIAEEMIQIVPNIDKARLYRGRGAEILREASCKLIENIARAQLPMNSKLQILLLEALNENVKQPHENIQLAASSALRQFLFYYLAASPGSGPFEKLQKLTVLKYLEGLKAAENAALTRGYAQALGVLPYHIICHPPELLSTIFEALGGAADQSARVAGEPDADTRRNAVLSISELGERASLAVFRSATVQFDMERQLHAQRADMCLRILLRSCEDYSVDKRGDTGSWSRIAGLTGLETLIYSYLRAVSVYPHDGAVSRFTRRRPIHSVTALSIPTAAVIPEDDPSDAKPSSIPVAVGVGHHVWCSYGHGIVLNINESAGVAIVQFPPQSLGYRESPSKDGIFSLRVKKLVVIGLSVLSADESDDLIDRFPAKGDRNFASDLLKVDAENNVAALGPLVSDEMVSLFMCVLLRQLGEKLDSVRVVAGSVLSRVLESVDPIVHSVSERCILKKTLDTPSAYMKVSVDQQEQLKSVVNWGQASFVFPFLSQLLEIDAYFHAIIAGFVISVGGLTEAIVKQSSAALLKWCRQKKKDKNVRDLSKLLNSLLRLFTEHEKNDRVIIPLLKTLQILYQNAIFDDILSGSDYPKNLLSRIKIELNKCSDTRKIRSCIDILMFLVTCTDPVRTSSLRAILTLLGHQYPQVRRYAAEQMYLLFISDSHVVGAPFIETDPSCIDIKCGLVSSQEASDFVSGLLTGTVWDKQIAVAREVRAKIALSMSIDLKLKVKSADQVAVSKPADELDSYEALVRDAGY